jgi:histidine triad (HIT) family protein
MTTSTDDCIFCGIIAGRLPCANVYEDEAVIAFLDIGPLEKGHTLVVPRRHAEDIMSCPDDDLRRVIVVARRVARALTTVTGARGVNVTQANGKLAGQVVPHLHVHVIPRTRPTSHPARWQPGHYDSNDEMADYARRLREALEAEAAAAGD